MERALGRDLSSVRVHEGEHALTMNALAFTQGNHIHFAPGQYRPWSQQGQDALRHELVHVAQQAEGRVPATRRLHGAWLNDDPRLERDADDRGRQAARAALLPHHGTPPEPFLTTASSRRATREGGAVPKDLAPLPAPTGAAPVQRLSMSDFDTVAKDVSDTLQNIPYAFGGSYAIAIHSGYIRAPHETHARLQNGNPVRQPKDIDLLFPNSKELRSTVRAMLDSKKFNFNPQDRESNADFSDNEQETATAESDEMDHETMRHVDVNSIEIDMSNMSRSEFAPYRQERTGTKGKEYVQVSNFPDRVNNVAPVEMLLAGALSRMNENAKNDISLTVDMIAKNRLKLGFIARIVPYVFEKDRVTRRWNQFFKGSTRRTIKEMTTAEMMKKLGADETWKHEKFNLDLL